MTDRKVIDIKDIKFRYDQYKVNSSKLSEQDREDIFLGNIKSFFGNEESAQEVLNFLNRSEKWDENISLLSNSNLKTVEYIDIDIDTNSKNNFEKSVNYLSSINWEIYKLNNLIGKYNEAIDKNTKQSLMKEIYKAQYDIDRKYSNQLKLGSKNYISQFYGTIQKDLKSQLSQIGFKSIVDLELKPSITNNNSQLQLANIISGMDQEKLNAFTKILSEYKDNDIDRNLLSLYTEGEDGYTEFSEWLSQNNIFFLGGQNSKNYKIYSADGGPFVLKVDNNLGVTEKTGDDLRNSNLSKYFAPRYADRRAYFSNKEGKTLIRSLVVTDFYSQGNLLAQRAQRDHKTALNIYLQMAIFLKEIQLNNIAFPDMKNENWLMHNNSLYIADTKSFLSTNGGSVSNESAFILTKKCCAPEMLTKEGYWSSDEIHSYIFGINLYEYLTRSNFFKVLNKSLLNIGLFRSPMGGAFRDIILDTVISTPELRSSMDNVLLRMEYLDKLDKISNYPKTSKYIVSQLELLKIHKKDDEKLKEILTKLNRVLKNLESKKNAPPKVAENSAATSSIVQESSSDALIRKSMDTLYRIKYFYFDSSDTNMTEYVNKQMQLLNEHKNDAERLKSILGELNSILDNMRTNPALNLIKKKVKYLRDNDSFYRCGMLSKAKMIENAYFSVPIPDRASLFKKGINGEYENKIEAAFASLRGSFSNVLAEAPRVPITNKIDEKRAARSYTNFKSELNEMKNAQLQGNIEQRNHHGVKR